VVTGVLINNLWSFAGNEDRPNVNAMTLQPFFNYNLPEGWYLTTSPLITANSPPEFVPQTFLPLCRRLSSRQAVRPSKPVGLREAS